jgi:hypothetical protein
MHEVTLSRKGVQARMWALVYKARSRISQAHVFPLNDMLDSFLCYCLWLWGEQSSLSDRVAATTTSTSLFITGALT